MADFRPDTSREGSSRPGRGPGRAILIAIAVFAVVAVCGAVALFSHGRSANPISTAGSATSTTKAPGDRHTGS